MEFSLSDTEQLLTTMGKGALNATACGNGRIEIKSWRLENKTTRVRRD